MNIPGSSIQTKVAFATTLLVGLISVFIYIYFPARLRDQAQRISTDEAWAASQMAALNIAPHVATGDVTSVYRALTALRENPDVAYIVTFGSRGAEPFAVYNMQLADSVNYRQITMTARQTPQGSYRAMAGPRSMGGLTQDGRIYQMKVPLREEGQNVGLMYLGLTTDRLAQEVDRNRRTVTTVAIAIFAVGMLFTIAISGAITRPLRHIAETAKRIA
ncbi:MAG: hypothetical protein ACXW2P_12700, partial [Thermoanaerobaculia bacterium]